MTITIVKSIVGRKKSLSRKQLGDLWDLLGTLTMNKEEIRPAVCVTRSGAWRQRAFAWALAHLNQKYERFVQKYKRQLFADLSGTVLEIGPGTGANLRYFLRESVRWIGIEPNPFMSQYLEEEGARLGMKIELRSGTADPLPVPDG